MTEKRKRAVIRGRWGEHAAAMLLRLKGFRVIARDVRTPVGEIDIIAKRGDLLVIAEVKTRPDLNSAVLSLTHHQRKRIERAAQAYAARHQQLAHCDIRFDLIAVAPFRKPRHIPDAWRPEA